MLATGSPSWLVTFPCTPVPAVAAAAAGISPMGAIPNTPRARVRSTVAAIRARITLVSPCLLSRLRPRDSMPQPAHSEGAACGFLRLPDEANLGVGLVVDGADVAEIGPAGRVDGDLLEITELAIVTAPDAAGAHRTLLHGRH